MTDILKPELKKTSEKSYWNWQSDKEKHNKKNNILKELLSKLEYVKSRNNDIIKFTREMGHDRLVKVGI